MLQFIVVGLVLGSIYALAASGLVITYVSTGVLNFAFGALAFFIARTYYYLNTEHQWGILASAAMCLLVLAPAMGLFLYLAIFRFLRLSSQLIKVVVTIGVSVVIPALAAMIFGNEEIFQAPGLASQPVSVYHVFGTAVTLDQVIAYVCVLAIVIIGALILRFTEAGLSVRAMVDSEAMTSLSGSNPSRIAAGVWVVSTFLAGLAGILAAPVIGLDSGKFTLLIAAAFAAVIAARLRSLPVAVIVALLMGIAGSLVQYYLPPDSDVTANIIPSIPFAFVVISLVVNIIRSGRVNEEEGVGGALDRAITPNGGARLAASTDSENLYPKLNFFFPIVLFAGICLLPLIFKPYWLGLMATGVCLAIIFISYTLVTGEGGMLWLCQITFAGVGALATGQLATEHGWPVLAAVIGGGVDRRGHRRGHRPADDPAREPLRRVGDVDLRAPHGAAGLQPEGLLAVRRRCRRRPPGVRDLRPRLHLHGARVLRGHRHPHREPAAFHDRPRAQRGALERERVPHHGAERHPDEDDRVGPGGVRGRRRRRSATRSRTSRRSRSTS